MVINIILIISICINFLLVFGGYIIIKKILMQALIFSDTIDNLQNTICPCKLYLIYNPAKQEDSIITDFSRYEKEGIVIITIFSKDSPPAVVADGGIAYYERAVVYQLGDTWLWQT